MDAEYQDEDSLNGVLTTSFRVYFNPELTDEVNSAKMDVCEVRGFHWINYVYQAQPSVQAINRKYVEGRMGPLKVCLESEGVDLDDGAVFTNLPMPPSILSMRVAKTVWLNRESNRFS